MWAGCVVSGRCGVMPVCDRLAEAGRAARLAAGIVFLRAAQPVQRHAVDSPEGDLLADSLNQPAPALALAVPVVARRPRAHRLIQIWRRALDRPSRWRAALRLWIRLLRPSLPVSGCPCLPLSSLTYIGTRTACSLC